MQLAAMEESMVKENFVGTNILGSLQKPQRVTEQEVSISKERKTCLVCKNKVEKYNFICPKCNAFYCQNCAETLTGLENACWMCETPFDESKPVKLQEIEEREIEIEQNLKKKGENK